MARLKYRHYDEYFDYDGPSRFLLAIDMEENGVIYTYNVKDKQCYVSEIDEGVENVVIADEIRVDSVGICPVVRWGIPLIDRKCVSNVKSIELGKNLKEFNELTTSELDNLERLVIPESIEKFPPFTKCNNLKEITMPAKFSMDLERFSWEHPKLQKVTLLHEGNRTEIMSRELDAKRQSYRIKLEKAEYDRITEEKRIEKDKLRQKRKENFIGWYAMIICAIPYLWAISNVFRNMVDYDSDFWDLINQLFIAAFLTAGLIAGWLIAVAGIIFISERSDWKISLALVLPIITIPLSYIVLSIAFALLTVFNSCSSGFYGIIDPRFIQ